MRNPATNLWLNYLFAVFLFLEINLNRGRIVDILVILLYESNIRLSHTHFITNPNKAIITKNTTDIAFKIHKMLFQSLYKNTRDLNENSICQLRIKSTINNYLSISRGTCMKCDRAHLIDLLYLGLRIIPKTSTNTDQIVLHKNISHLKDICIGSSTVFTSWKNNTINSQRCIQIATNIHLPSFGTQLRNENKITTDTSVTRPITTSPILGTYLDLKGRIEINLFTRSTTPQTLAIILLSSI